MAVVVEDRYSGVFARAGPAGRRRRWLGEAAARFPTVPIVFAETRALAQEWAYRFLAAAVAHHYEDVGAAPRVADLASVRAVPPPAPTTAEVRAWARDAGLGVTDRGRLPPDVWSAYSQAHPSVGGDD